VDDAVATKASWGDTVEVVVARRDIRPGEPLDGDATAVRSLPRALVTAGALHRSPPDAVAAAPIAAGEPIPALRVGRGDRSPVAALLPEGTRGVAVPRPDGLVVQVGDEVDVVASQSGFSTGGPVVAASDSAVVVAVPAGDVTTLAQAANQDGVVVVLRP
jgi:Flp pilus assembly protein CpaB